MTTDEQVNIHVPNGLQGPYWEKYICRQYLISKMMVAP